MKRYALCIGVNDHDDPQISGLYCACNDAEELAFTLRQQGVDAITMTRRISADAVYRYLRELGTKLVAGDVFIFFFAGHGKTLHQATGQSDQLFLLPDASASLLAQGSIAAAPGLLSWNVLKTLTDSWTEVKRLFIFDACRLPLDSASMRDTGATVLFEGEGVFRDLKLSKRTPLQGGVGLAVLNSCTDGQQAEELRDYPGNGHGLLTAAMLELLSEANQVGTWLATDSHFAQRLTQRMQLIGQRYGAIGQGQTPLLVGEPVPLVLPKEVPAEPPSPPRLAGYEAEWLICCAKGRLEDYEAFVRQHPGNPHLREALGKITELSALARLDTASPILGAATAKAPTSETPKQSAPATSRFRKLEAVMQVADCEACGEMAKIEAGSFEMGSAEGEPGARADEKPRHRVTLKAFEIGRTVVTQGQWKAVMGDNPSFFAEAGDAWPVESISWDDAQEFLKKLNERTGKTYRLPTEEEWEYAARAGSNTAFWWGNHIDTTQANYYGNQTYNGGAKGEYRESTVKADSFEANPWGLYNVHGNVWEWVQDTHHSNYKGAPDDGRA